MKADGEQGARRLEYRRIFDPQPVDVRDGASEADLDDASVYVFDDEALVLAVNVAVAAGRCLLVLGPAGSGKSSLAANVARILAVPYFVQTITSRTQAQDLLWTTDLVRRLNDAQAHDLQPDEHYQKKGVLWHAFLSKAGDGNAPFAGAPRTSCVVLLDEIDKAEADVTDGLLVPLDARCFPGPDGEPVHSMDGQPLIIITSNNERDLSKPFLRRCVVATLQPPTKDHLITVANAKFGQSYSNLHAAVADLFMQARDAACATGSHIPNTAEFLDAVRACREMEITPGSQEWDPLARVVLNKEQRGT
jgi:MoxR-like ATPase